MALNAGFQYLEQRDGNDNIVKQGVVSKKQPFANSNNTGIYDVIAENLRFLYERDSSSGTAFPEKPFLGQVFENTNTGLTFLYTTKGWQQVILMPDALAEMDEEGKPVVYYEEEEEEE